LYADWQLPDAASWRLNIGLAGGVMRYASVSAELLNASQRVADWLATDIGSRIQVVGLPAQHPQSTVDLLVQGYTEQLRADSWAVSMNCSPAEPWRVAEIADDNGDDGAMVLG